MTVENHIKRKSKLLRSYKKSMSRAKSLLISYYGEQQAKSIIDESQQEYENLIPQIPYIGDKNPLQIFMLPTVRMLAIYRTLQKHGQSDESIGHLIYMMAEIEIQTIPRFVRRIIGYLWFSSFFSRRMKKYAKESQKRKYPDDFVFNYIKGDGKSFDFGIDYLECANCKFLNIQGALKLAPYICATDKVASEMLGWGLKRTMTLAEGYEKCDFRFKKGARTNVRDLNH